MRSFIKILGKGFGYRLRLAVIAATLSMLAVVAGCGGAGSSAASGGEGAVDSEARDSEAVVRARDAVGLVIHRDASIEAARTERQKIVDWNTRLENHIRLQRTILEDVRRTAPTIVAGDSFTEGPCYDGTMPDYSTDYVWGPQNDTDAEVQSRLSDMEEIEVGAEDALDALDALSASERRAAASEDDQQATRDVLNVASELRRGLSQDYATLKKTYKAVEPENEELKDDIRQLRIDAGCQMG